MTLPVPTRRLAAVVAASIVVLLVVGSDGALLAVEAVLLLLALLDLLLAVSPARIAVERRLPASGVLDAPVEMGWTVEHLGLRVEMVLGLPVDDVAELWELRVTNLSGRSRRLSVVPYFPIGYMSWMNQSAQWRAEAEKGG